MEGASTLIRDLIDTGNSFIYANFAEKTERGYVSALTPAWVSWTIRVEGALSKIFSSDSSQLDNIKRAKRLDIIGNGPEMFSRVKSIYMGSLLSAHEIIEDDVFGEVNNSSSAPLKYSKRVFIVHGRDDVAKNELEGLIREFGLEPVILHRQADGGKTIIEKFEHYADVGFAFILLTPDEISYLSSENDLEDSARSKEYRARPNVIFEFGYFVGKLGRARTCCLYRSPVVVPSDINGLVYKSYSKSIEEVGYAISKELKLAGYTLA